MASVVLKRKLAEKTNPITNAPPQSGGRSITVNITNSEPTATAASDTNVISPNMVETVWHSSESSIGFSGPRVPDFRLSNKDFRDIGTGRLKSNSGQKYAATTYCSPTDRLSEASTLPSAQEDLEMYCRMTEKSLNANSHHLTRVANDPHGLALPLNARTRVRRVSEPSGSSVEQLQDREDSNVATFLRRKRRKRTSSEPSIAGGGEDSTILCWKPDSEPPFAYNLKDQGSLAAPTG